MFSTTAFKIGLPVALNYLSKDPEKNIPKLMSWVDKIAGDNPNSFPVQRAYIRDVINNPDSNWYKLIMRIFHETDNDVMKTFFTNFILNTNMIGWQTQEKYRKKYNCNIPWAILLDPTSACNKHCVGCWAAEYGHKLNLSYEDICSIIDQGRELGTYLYIYTGGEPMVRKKDLIRLCEKYKDCVFLSFTNGSLIDEEFANDMLRVKNFVPAISVEGTKESHDGRRGEGSFVEVERAMKLLKDKKLPFGISTCYTKANVDVVGSSEFLDDLIERGADFIWYFHYMPVGMDSTADLLPTPEQREFMFNQIRKFRSEKSIFMMDFQNDGQYVGGCIAGGRRYLHINANGDVDPCVFIHYSNCNIHKQTLLECLRSPLFQAYHDNQPFNENHLRPCPMLENPERIVKLVKETGAHSTDPQAPESAEHLTSKTVPYAENWKPTAERLWSGEMAKKEQRDKKRQEMMNAKVKEVK